MLAEYFIANCSERLPVVRITLYEDGAPIKGFRKDDSEKRNPRPVRFDGRTEGGQDITAVLMPVSAEDSQFAMRPDQVRAAEEKAEAEKQMAEARTEAEAETANEALDEASE